MDLNQAWLVLTESLNPISSQETGGSLPDALQVLAAHDMLDASKDYVLTLVEKSIQASITPLLESKSTSGLDFPTLINLIFEHALSVKGQLTLYEKAYENTKPGENIMDECQRVYRITLDLPYYKQTCRLVEEFYSLAYDICGAAMEEDDEDLEEESCGTKCTRCKRAQCCCSEVNSQILTTKSKIADLGLFSEVVNNVLYKISQSKIKEFVTKECSENFDKYYLSDLEIWLDDQLLVWLNKAVNMKQNNLLNKQTLKSSLYNCYVSLRLSELLAMIIDYPDSKPAFEDLGECLPHTNFRKDVIKSLKHVFQSRVLHPGVATTDILTAYIQSIQALRVLDPSCVILEIVTDPVKQYLRSREDTVRCIVSNLIDESCDVLYEELNKGTTDHDLLDDDNIGDDWESWLPDPVDADPAVSAKTRRSTDIINMLINVYGTKDLFIKEYWNLLADRLLTNLSYTTLWEIKYFELLKIRFGEADLHKCEVMLKDIADSKRLNSWINDELQKDTSQNIPVNVMVLSAQYWPSFRDEKLTLPPFMQSALDKYTETYKIIRANRTLQWKPHLGQVDIDIELDCGKTLTYKTSPVNVAVIMAFEDKESLSVDELSEKLQLTNSAVRRCASYWQTRGLLKEQSPDTYKLNKDPMRLLAPENVEEEEAESALASAEQQKEEEFEMLWTYINGMLTNMDAQPLTRIHSLLKMFANTDCSTQDLEKFLGQKVREGKLVFTSGVYKLPTS